MPKRVQIQDTDQLELAIIGIASNAKVWKVCFELNQVLELNLVAEESESFDSNPNSDSLSLFHDHPTPEHHQGEFHSYRDLSSSPNCEYRLLEIQKSLLPKAVRSFAYFLFIRFGLSSAPRKEELLAALHQSEHIISAVDCSHLHQLKHYWL